MKSCYQQYNIVVINLLVFRLSFSLADVPILLATLSSRNIADVSVATDLLGLVVAAAVTLAASVATSSGRPATLDHSAID
jgi:hypothetical protein